MNKWEEGGDFFVLKSYATIDDQFFENFKVIAVFKKKGSGVGLRMRFGGKDMSITEYNSLIGNS